MKEKKGMFMSIQNKDILNTNKNKTVVLFRPFCFQEKMNALVLYRQAQAVGCFVGNGAMQDVVQEGGYMLVMTGLKLRKAVIFSFIQIRNRNVILYFILQDMSRLADVILHTQVILNMSEVE